MDELSTSLNKIDGIVKHKLKGLSEKASPTELNELHSFLKEVKDLKQTILAIENPYINEMKEALEHTLEEDDGGEEYEIDGEFLNYFLEGCHLIRQLYLLMDDHKIKETQSDWIFEEARNFMEGARAMVGPRVPELPVFRIVSKKRQTKPKGDKNKKEG
jgi:hypothetical protein